MKTYIFPYGGSFGNGDSWENEVNVVLSNKDAERLEQSAKKESRRRLEEDPDIWDIEDKVEKAARKQEINNIPEDILDSVRYRYFNDDQRLSYKTLAKRYLEDSSFHVSYPEELQGLE